MPETTEGMPPGTPTTIGAIGGTTTGTDWARAGAAPSAAPATSPATKATRRRRLTRWIIGILLPRFHAAGDPARVNTGAWGMPPTDAQDHLGGIPALIHNGASTGSWSRK